MTEGDASTTSDAVDSSRSRILDAALGLFSRRGYGETSVADLARAAGVSKGLVYHYFDTKQDVLSAVLARGSERVEAALGPDGGISSPAAPVTLVMEVLARVAEDVSWWRLLFRVRTHPELAAELGVAGWGSSLQEELERSLREAGSAAPGREAMTLAAAVEGAAQRYVSEPDRYPLVEAAEAIVAHVS